MGSLRGPMAMVLCFSFCVSTLLPAAVVDPPMGILTRATEAQLNLAVAYPGLSVFEGEALSTSTEGKLGVRVGAASLALSQGAHATLQRVEKGTHVDLSRGTLYFAAPERVMIEVHVADAFLRPAGTALTQAEVRLLGPKVLQVSAMRGGLEFTYRDEYQVIPEGETYRIYLEAPAEPQRPAGAGAPPMTAKSKVAFYIVTGAAATSLTAWGVHELVESKGGPESPAKP